MYVLYERNMLFVSTADIACVQDKFRFGIKKSPSYFIHRHHDIIIQPGIAIVRRGRREACMMQVTKQIRALLIDTESVKWNTFSTRYSALLATSLYCVPQPISTNLYFSLPIISSANQQGRASAVLWALSTMCLNLSKPQLASPPAQPAPASP